jgi:hypothetical protein
MFQKIFDKISGGFIGLITGFVIGPFAAIGKFFALVSEENKKLAEEAWDEYHTSVHPSTIIVGIVVFFICGLIYGSLRGCFLGAQEGPHKRILHEIAKEMFDYSHPWYADRTPRHTQPAESTYTSIQEKKIVTSFKKESKDIQLAQSESNQYIHHNIAETHSFNTNGNNNPLGSSYIPQM